MNDGTKVTTPQQWAKRREEMRTHPNPMMEGGDEAGWGKARPGLDWVKPR